MGEGDGDPVVEYAFEVVAEYDVIIVVVEGDDDVKGMGEGRVEEG